METSTIVTLLSIGSTLFFVTTLVLSYTTANLLKKNEKYEEQISEYETWLKSYRGEIDNVYKRLKMVDEKNLFERDDDVGFVFSEILRVIKEFDENVN